MSPRPTHHRRQQARSSPTPTLSRTNLGPLTTTFTAPSHCSSAALACPTCNKAFRGQTCRAGLEDDASCWPQATTTATLQQGRGPVLGFYSPGLICPTGYASACTAISAAAPQTTSPPVKVEGQFQFPLVAGETAIGCCPTGYTCALESGSQTCHQVATSTRFDAMVCDGSSQEELRGFAIPMAVGARTIASLDMWAPMVQINHRATDRPDAGVRIAGISSAVASSSVEASSTATVVGGAAGASGAPKGNEKGLSTQTIIGIVVAGVVILLCLLSLFVYFFCIRKRLRKTMQPRHAKKFSSSSSSINSTEERGIDHGGKVHTIAAFSTPIKKSEISRPVPSPVPWGDEPVYEDPAGAGRNRVADVYANGTIRLDTEAVRVGRPLAVDDEMESPIDGSSPFRLKRGNTVKRVDNMRSPERGRAASPLRNQTNAGIDEEIEAAYAVGIEESLDRAAFTVGRARSYSRPRPKSRGGRDSSIGSSVASSTVDGERSERAKSMRRADSFSRPRPSKKNSPKSTPRSTPKSTPNSTPKSSPQQTQTTFVKATTREGADERKPPDMGVAF